MGLRKGWERQSILVYGTVGATLKIASEKGTITKEGLSRTVHETQIIKDGQRQMCA